MITLLAPNCWNGEFDSPDHTSHLVWNNEATGDCPPDFRRIPQLQINAEYTFGNSIPFSGDQTPLEFADGSKSAGFHADFIGGWNIESLQTITTSCAELEPEQDCLITSGAFQVVAPEVTTQCKVEVQFPSDPTEAAGVGSGMSNSPNGNSHRDGMGTGHVH